MSSSFSHRVGVPREIKEEEYRVGLTPAGVRELVEHGQTVAIEAGAGEGSGILDSAYAEQGATILPDADTLFAQSEIIVKVKEPQPVEIARLLPEHILFTYLHLAPDRSLTDGLLASGATSIAYETVRDSHGRLPLLAPMSEVAGKLAAQAGASVLEKPRGGHGILLGGVSGVPPARVLVIGGGVVGESAARVALGMGAAVRIYDRSLDRLRDLDLLFEGRVETCFSSTLAIEEQLPSADLVIGAVLLAGARAPHVISRGQLSLLRPGSVLVDVAIDQGGCFETSHPTSHAHPTFVVEGIVHYCVANMPGAVPVTSTRALANATLPYVVRLALSGPRAALADDPGFLEGLSTWDGNLTSEAVARDQDRDFTAPVEALVALPA